MFSSNTSAATAANYIEDVFSTYLYTGNGSTQTITNGIDLAGKGGWVWFKNRGAVGNNTTTNTVTGGRLLTDTTGALGAAVVSSFNSDGFSLNTASTPNQSGNTFVSWTFRDQAKFFDVVTYTGNGTAGRTIAHNLGSAPGFMVVKKTSAAGDNWMSWHRSISGSYILLNTTGASVASQQFVFGNDTIAIDPTATVFTLASDGSVNANGATYVAYLFAHDAGGFGLTGTDNVISCGSFTTDGSGNATVSLGYEPQWVLFKNSAGAGSWRIYDSMRGIPTGGNDAVLFPNLSAAEDTGSDAIDLTSTGFLVKGQTATNAHIYIAIRRGPMKVPTDGTKVYNEIPRTGTGAATSVTGLGFSPDVVIGKRRAAADEPIWFDKLRGATKYLYSSATNAEATDAASLISFDMDGFSLGADNNFGKINFSGRTYANWAFRRAPGFFDEVCYTGTGANTTVTHNLAAVPELMIVKSRTVGGIRNWAVYSSALGATKFLLLNLTNAEGTNTYWNNTTPTASVFSLDGSTLVNNTAENYVAYLFATCPGVSKVGSYTGTATTQTINCGFTGGARFVMIKRTDSTGDWYVWDTARGIVAGNDPYLLLNSTAAEVTSTDYIDTASTGFEISSTAPAAINASGGTFIFLAIA